MSMKLFLSVLSTVFVVLFLWDRLVWSLKSKDLFLIFLVTSCGFAVIVDCLSQANQSEVIDLMLRGIMLCYGLAAYSLYVQAEGLSGKTGLLPLSTQVAKTKQWVHDAKVKLSMLKGSSYWYLCSITCILNIVLELFKDATSVALVSIYIVGASAFGAFVFPHPLAFALCYVGYFGTRRMLPEFLNLQWDALLLEAGVYGFLLSVVQSLGGIRSAKLTTNACVALFKILSFRLMFGSGMVKHFSGDVSWQDGTAMNYHFFTQPLPGVFAPFLQAQPDIVKKVACFLALYFVELFVPAVSVVTTCTPLSGQIQGLVNVVTFAVYGGLQLSISLGGNFGFFNLLSQVLALSLLEDSHFRAAFAHSDLNQTTQSSGAGTASLVPQGIVGWALTAFVLPLTGLLLLGNLVAVLKLCRHCRLAPEFEKLTETVRATPTRAGSRSPDAPKLEESLSSPFSSGTASANIHSPRHFTTRKLPEEGEKEAATTSAVDGGLRGMCIDALLFAYGTALNFHSSLGVFSVACHYGLFAHMTKFRDEVLLEVSDDYFERSQQQNLGAFDAEDAALWRPVEFLYKPGSGAGESRQGKIKKILWPPLHMPRLDWRLWFVPLNPSVQAVASAISATKVKLASQLAEAQKGDQLSAITNPPSDGKPRATKVQAVVASSRETVEYLREKVGMVLPKWLLVLLCGILEEDKATAELLGGWATTNDCVSTLEKGRSGKLSGEQVMENRRYVRITISRYSFAPLSATNVFGTSGVWQCEPKRSVLPPCSLGMLYALLDGKDDVRATGPGMSEEDRKTRLQDLPDHLKPETAAEIIQRTLFRQKNQKRE